MHEFIIDEGSFESAQELHAYLADSLGFPAYYGANLDALGDCLGDVQETVAIEVFLANEPASEQMGTWIPRLCRTLLRAARDNECLSVLVHADSMRALARLASCPGMVDLLDDDVFIAQGLVACLGQEDNGERPFVD